ncbi:MAG TPA: tRNA lysidine(34) synthetase TilS [Terriglobales bacterium]|nr:tRNA lysidine(34) synthetase TilS [Terriglobales bacterium]
MASSLHALAARLTAWSERHQLLAPGDRVAVAVSGGADSVALLLLLAELAEPLGLQLGVAHFDHRWRPDSAADADWVAALAQRLGLPFFLGCAPAMPPPGNREQVARRLRYAFLQGLVASAQATRIATAHTADDQAETVLLRLLRGAGATGLAGILPARDGARLVRPLLFARRLELRHWLQARGQSWREDPSNLALDRRRNLLRLRFLPELAAAFNPALVERLAILAELARAEEEFWAAALPPLRDRLFAPTPQGCRAARAELQALPLAVRRRLLRAAIAHLKGDLRRVDFAAIEELVAWLGQPARHPRLFALAGVHCRLSAQWLDLALQGRL